MARPSHAIKSRRHWANKTKHKTCVVGDHEVHVTGSRERERECVCVCMNVIECESACETAGSTYKQADTYKHTELIGTVTSFPETESW